MVDFTKSRTLAQRLIEKHGRLATLVRTAAAPSDPTKPWKEEDPNVEPLSVLGPVLVCFVGIGGQLGRDFVAPARELGVRISEVGLLAALSVEALAPDEPDPGKYQTLEDGERVFRIVKVQELRPAELPVLYYLGLET